MKPDGFYDHDPEDVPDEPRPRDSYAVVGFRDGYGIVPMALVKDGADVLTTTRTIETAELDLADLLDDDDDPRCVCGVHRSEHSLCGCPEGFQRKGSWAVEREFIIGLDDDEYELRYGNR